MNEFADIASELKQKGVRLVAVSKTRTIEEITLLYDQGQRDFGENRVQELRDKYPLLPGDIRWHLIGHLQTNKVKYIAPWIHLIQSVDSLILLQEIDRQAQKCKRIIPCLLQVYVAQEQTKFGLTEAELNELLTSPEFASLKNIRIEGIMGMATNTEDAMLIKKEFARLQAIFTDCRARFFAGADHFATLSMGMSSDYKSAVQQGSNMVRIGSLLFS